MPFVETGFAGLILFEPNVFGDDRGYFFESYNLRDFHRGGIHTAFVQDNQARSSYGVLRGLHYQVAPYAQAKLVRTTEGEVLDVVVDLRPHSATYGQSYSVKLSAENKRQLFIPRGFSHGYAVLSEVAEFFYKCDNYYSRPHEGGLRYDDPAFNIDWGIPENEVLLSEKDQLWPKFGEHRV